MSEVAQTLTAVQQSIVNQLVELGAEVTQMITSLALNEINEREAGVHKIDAALSGLPQSVVNAWLKKNGIKVASSLEGSAAPATKSKKGVKLGTIQQVRYIKGDMTWKGKAAATWVKDEFNQMIQASPQATNEELQKQFFQQYGVTEEDKNADLREDFTGLFNAAKGIAVTKAPAAKKAAK